MRVEPIWDLVPAAERVLWSERAWTWHLISCGLPFLSAAPWARGLALHAVYEISNWAVACCLLHMLLISDFIILTNCSVLTKRPSLTCSRVSVRDRTCCHKSVDPSPIRPTMKFSCWTWRGSQPSLSPLPWSGQNQMISKTIRAAKTGQRN